MKKHLLCVILTESHTSMILLGFSCIYSDSNNLVGADA